jgi:negative regulator of sigma E activity
MHLPLGHADGGSPRQLSAIYHAAMVAVLKPSPKKAQTHVFFQTPPMPPNRQAAAAAAVTVTAAVSNQKCVHGKRTTN